MSFEYAIVTSGRADLASLSKRLMAYGLVPGTAEENRLEFSHSSTPNEQLVRWGPDVQVCRKEGEVLLTILSGDHERVLREVIGELSRQGVFVSYDEP